MKSKKVYIVLIAIIFIFFIVMFLLFGVDELKKESYNTTIIVGDDTVWKYDKKTWNNVFSHDDVNWKKFDVYLDGEKKGNYYLWYSDGWYAFDNKKNAITIDSELLAINSNVDISVYNFIGDEITDYSYVYDVLKTNKLSNDNTYTSNQKVVFDFDNDGVEEEFYLITNAFSTESNIDKVFSIVFMVKNEKTYPIYTNISENTGFNGCMPYFSSFLDVDNDSKYEFILSCSKYSTSGTTRMLYEFNKDKFKILISNNK